MSEFNALWKCLNFSPFLRNPPKVDSSVNDNLLMEGDFPDEGKGGQKRVAIVGFSFNTGWW